MKRICLILPCNLFVVPYFQIYEKTIIDSGCSFDVVLWNRNLVSETCCGHVFAYDVGDKANDKNVLKIFKYFGFYRFAKKIIKKEKYDKIIFLDTSSFTLIFMRHFLKRNYYKQYWVDVRDYTFEKNPFYKKMLESALKNAYMFDVSSRGFFEFLPPLKNYCVTHNIDFETIENIKTYSESKSDKIRISFIGNVRYYDLNKRLLVCLKNDDRFLVQFYGVGSETLEQFCLSEGIKNVSFIGRFDRSMTPILYQQTDLINNIYGNKTMEVRTALSNKLYYSIFLNKPILVSPDTFLASVVEKYNLGFAVDFSSDNLANDLYNWYTQRNGTDDEKRLSIIESIINDYNDYILKLKNFIVGN